MMYLKIGERQWLYPFAVQYDRANLSYTTEVWIVDKVKDRMNIDRKWERREELANDQQGSFCFGRGFGNLVDWVFLSTFLLQYVNFILAYLVLETLTLWRREVRFWWCLLLFLLYEFVTSRLTFWYTVIFCLPLFVLALSISSSVLAPWSQGTES